jgi:CHAD domain-containing protein
MRRKPERFPPDSMTILERSRGVLFARWEELLRFRRKVLKTSDPDDIHDLRVASRRFRAALELMHPLVTKTSKTELRKNVRKLTRILGGLRNIDEAQLFFQQRAPAIFSGGSSLIRSLEELRCREKKQIGRELKTFDHRGHDHQVREMVAGLNQENISSGNRFSLLAYFSEISIRQYLPIHQLHAVAKVPECSSERHALRIAIKKWRYFLEVVSQILDRDYEAVLEQLKEYQGLLGRMNDIVEFRVLLDQVRLPFNEQDHAEKILLEEDALLIRDFITLAEQKPLNYSFLI